MPRAPPTSPPLPRAPAGVYTRRILAAALEPLPTALSINGSVQATCGTSGGKGTVTVNVASSALILEAAASAATILEPDNALCDGAVTVQVGGLLWWPGVVWWQGSQLPAFFAPQHFRAGPPGEEWRLQRWWPGPPLGTGGSLAIGTWERPADVPCWTLPALPQLISQVLQPCCSDVKPLLQGGSGRMPVLVNTTEATVVGFQDALTVDATGNAVGGACWGRRPRAGQAALAARESAALPGSMAARSSTPVDCLSHAQASQAKTIFVPTEEAWTLVDWSKLLASQAEPTAAQKEAVLQALALYHMSYDSMTIPQLAASSSSSVSAAASAQGTSKGLTLGSALGQAEQANTWSCQQKVRRACGRSSSHLQELPSSAATCACPEARPARSTSAGAPADPRPCLPCPPPAQLTYTYKPPGGGLPSQYILTSDHGKSTAKVTGFFQTCSGTTIYQVRCAGAPTGRCRRCREGSVRAAGADARALLLGSWHAWRRRRRGSPAPHSRTCCRHDAADRQRAAALRPDQGCRRGPEPGARPHHWGQLHLSDRSCRRPKGRHQERRQRRCCRRAPAGRRGHGAGAAAVGCCGCA
jgi:hypothetical protein